MILREYKEKDSERIMNLYNETTKKFNIQDLNENQKCIILFKNEWLVNELMISNITLVLEIESEIVWFVMMKKDWYINFLYIDKDNLNKWYWKTLINWIEKKAKEIWLKKVYLYSSIYSSKYNIYEKLGYKNLWMETYYIKDIPFEWYKMLKKLN